MATVVNVQEAKTRLSELLRRVEAGDAVVIARAGRPIAELRAVGRPDFVYGGFHVELGPDFDQDLPGDEADAWIEGGPSDPLRR